MCNVFVLSILSSLVFPNSAFWNKACAALLSCNPGLLHRSPVDVVVRCGGVGRDPQLLGLGHITFLSLCAWAVTLTHTSQHPHPSAPVGEMGRLTGCWNWIFYPLAQVLVKPK